MTTLLTRILTWRRQRAAGGSPGSDGPPRPLAEDLEGNLKEIRDLFGSSPDLIVRRFRPGAAPQVEAALVYLDGMVHDTVLNQHILVPLLRGEPTGSSRPPRRTDLVRCALDRLVAAGNVSEVSDLDKIWHELLAGRTVVLFDGCPTGLAASAKGWATRSVADPGTESVIRGSREGFTEDLQTNITLLRRRFRDPRLHVEFLTLGRRTRTKVALVYLDGVSSPSVLAEARRRLRGVDLDSVLESGYIEQYIEDAPYSVFSTVGNSEKPDVVAAKLLEGRVAIMVDGTPFVLLAPYLFIESLQSAEDYYSRPFYVTMLRLIRAIAFVFSILLPALYVAVTSYHQELLPSTLAVTLAATREGTPFPSIVEALAMGVVFEILREAGVRLPRPIGQAISIVGALVIGQAAVQAGLIGSLMVIVVALTGVATFVVPAQIDAGIIFRTAFTLLAGVLGLYGIVLGLLLSTAHAAMLSSFGTPYLSPLTPFSAPGLLDTLIRAPLWVMRRRPAMLHPADEVRRGRRPRAPRPGGRPGGTE